MGTPGRLDVAGPGSNLVETLRDLLDDARRGDPLAPVDVVVPSPVAGVTLRRAVAADGGLANVRFGSFPQLAARLAARRLALGYSAVRPPLTEAVRRRALRTAVTQLGTGHDPGSLAAAAEHPATVSMLVRLVTELDSVRLAPEATSGAQQASLTPRGREVLELYRSYQTRVAGWSTPGEVTRAATAAVESGQAPPTHVIVVGPARLTADERDLLQTLRRRGRLSALVPGADLSSSTAAADVPATRWLVDLFGAPATVRSPGTPPDVHLTIAPDAEEEVRIAVRRVVRELASRPLRPERVGIAYRSPAPYARLLAEQLGVAGLPHHVPGERTLLQTIAGRTLTGLLDLHRRGYPRPDVIRWLSDAPVLDGVGRRVPADQWDRVSRDAGVSRGLSNWRDRLERFAVEREARAVAGDALSAGDASLGDGRWRAATARALAAHVAEIASAAADVDHAPDWPQVASALRFALVRCLGRRRSVDGWTLHPGVEVGEQARTEIGRRIAIEQQGYDAVLAAVAELAELRGAGPGPGPAVIREALRDALEQPVPSGSTLGQGLLVAPIGQFAGADLDLLLVVGMTEGSFPPRQHEHALLRDADREVISPDLATATERRERERRRWQGALAGARRVELSYPRADSRAQRRQFAAPWYLEHASLLAGRPIGAAEVETVVAPWLTRHASFAQAIGRAGAADLRPTFASAHELDVHLAMSGAASAVAAVDHRLTRGLAAVRARSEAEFGSWTGHVGPLPAAVRVEVDGGLSATTLQEWATCPARHFFGRVLGIRELEDRGGTDTIDARDKGSLVHGVLEKLFGGQLGSYHTPGRSPDSPWTTAEIHEARALLDADAADLAARGLTGHPVLWQAQLARLHRALARILALDNVLRARRRAWPIAVEAAFGRDEVPDLVVTLASAGDVRFAGSIDRVDATESGGLVVLDYKTGSASGYQSIPRAGDPKGAGASLIDRGRKLQLVLYSLAARQLFGPADAGRDAGLDVEAYYWFVEQGDLHHGAPIGSLQERDLRDVLDVVVGGIRGGVYPAHPGEETWRGSRQSFAACAYCPFDRVCPTNRAEQWRTLRGHPLVSAYAAVADPAAPAPDHGDLP